MVLVLMTLTQSDDSVICTELHRQGLIPTRIYRANLIYYRNHSNEEQVRAYHSWAVPVVRLMKKSKLATRIIQPFGKAWAYEMAYRVNKYPESNLLGRIIVDTLHPMHKLIGKIAFTEKKHNNVEGLGE